MSNSETLYKWYRKVSLNTSKMTHEKNILALFLFDALFLNNIERSLACQCGTTQGSRVIGGTDISPGTYPWMTLMVSDVSDNEQQICGASLISANYAVTAKHCTTKVSAGNTVLIPGITNISSITRKTPRLYADRFIQYPGSKSDDIALVKLLNPANFNMYVQPICLPPMGSNFVGQTAYYCGFGVADPNSKDISYELQGGKATVPTNSQCNEALNRIGGQLEKNEICAGTHDGEPATCFGDSGGPLMVNNVGIWELIGVTSGTYSCTNPEGYGLFVNVASFVNWIYSNSGGTACIK